jgi:hypothetical protein
MTRPGLPHEIVVEHQRYIDDARYRLAVHTGLRQLIGELPGLQGVVSVIHEDDESCCRREPWSTTYQSIGAALKADGAGVLRVVL